MTIPMTVVLLPLDEDSRRIEVAALRYGGFEVATAHSVEQAVTHVRVHRADAVVIDPSMANVEQMVGELRSRTELPIIVLSETGGEGDVVIALNAGADDCIAKPFAVEELVARMRAVTRRGQRSEVVAPIVTDDFTVDLAARRVFRPDVGEVSLTGVEWRMVEILLRRPGHLVLRQQLFEEIWGPRGAHSPNYLRVFVARVRQKLEPEPACPRYLLTVKGLALVFEVGPGHLDHEAAADDSTSS